MVCTSERETLPTPARLSTISPVALKLTLVTFAGSSVLICTDWPSTVVLAVKV
ncbi:hypothetical protein D3C80_2243260 [compost metagenome]